MRQLLLPFLLLPLFVAGCDNPETCLDACGEPHSEGYICGEDGWVYRGECQLACHGLEPAQDELLCAAPIANGECTRSRDGELRFSLEADGSLHPIICEAAGNSVGWAQGLPPFFARSNPCFADCPPCPEDEDEFICGKKGVRYCNACVMECLEDEVGDESACGATAMPAHFCDPETERYATRNWWGSAGCNVCECAPSGLWHCTCWACPGEEEAP